MMFTRNAKLAATLPKGEKNGLDEPDVVNRLTDGYGKERRHVAIVELSVRKQITDIEGGQLTNVVGIERIEIIDGPDVELATRILRDQFTARQPEPLPGMGPDDMLGENVEGRGNE